MKLWLDDVRPPPDGWVWVKSAPDAYVHLDKYWYDIEEVSLDHDLGDPNPRVTGKEVASYIGNRHRRKPRPLFPMHCHSMNPVGKERILKVYERIIAEQSAIVESATQ